jgi:uncharacterized protein YdeI (YjbR/CyaY-like superfamily)
MPTKQTSKASSQNTFVEIPAELKKALSEDGEAQSIFDALPASHQKEYVTWIIAAKREETRQRRAAQTVEMLKQGRK